MDSPLISRNFGLSLHTESPTFKIHKSDIQPTSGRQIVDIKLGASVYGLIGNNIIIATVSDICELHLVLKCSETGKEHRVPKRDVSLRNLQQKFSEIQDLSQISPLSPPAVLHCLEERYGEHLYYTRAGSALIAVNPFQDCSHLYTSDVINKYQTHDEEGYGKLPPHVFWTARNAYSKLTYNLDSGDGNQSIIVSGESGAGKTVSAKHLMKYLVSVSADDENVCNMGSRIEQRILESNPILEAFGNASTLRNANSSRFGKYIEMQFDRKGMVEGATLQTYLLEKTRVVWQAPEEFNFHIFYQLLSDESGAFNQFLSNLSGDLMQCNLAKMEGRNIDTDSKSWETTKTAMTYIGIDESLQAELFRILFAILHLGNVQFMADEDDDEIISIHPDDKDSQHHSDMAAWLLGVDGDKLERTFTHRKITASHRRRQSVFHKPCTSEEVHLRRDCLAKVLYARLFEYIVEYINKRIMAPQSYKKTGILDIYGFESFKDNSLEQLCINYANEKLQQHYVKHFLRDLQADYESEAISWQPTEFEDNRPCLELLESNTGIFAILDEECHMNRPSNDEGLKDRFHATLSENKYLLRARKNLNVPSFVVKHYAETVPYTVHGLIEKNKDNVPGELVELLHQSDYEFITSLFGDFEPEQPGKKKKSVLSKFKASLNSLMQALRQTEPHYIRCIKPNTSSVPSLYDRPYVLSQLQACGVIETVEISKQAYPARISYVDFLQRYGLILRANENTTLSNLSIISQTEEDDNKENEMFFEPLDALYKKQLNITPRRKHTTPKRKLRRRAGLSSCDHTRRLSGTVMKLVFGEDAVSAAQFGLTKVFLKDGQLERLEAERTHLISQHAFTIQCAWRRHVTRRRKREMEATIRIQSIVRGWLVRQDLKQKIKSAAIIQRAFRRHRAAKLIGSRSSTSSTGTEDNFVSFGAAHDEDKTFNGKSTLEANDEFFTPATCRTLPPGQGRSPMKTPLRKHAEDFFTPKNFPAQPRFVSTPKIDACDDVDDDAAEADNDTYLVAMEKTDEGSVYNIYKSPSKKVPGSQTAKEVYKNVAAALMAAYLNQRRFQLAGAFTGIPYLEAQSGILSRRRMPRVQIKFHTRANPILKYGHYLHQKEFMCSITDCLQGYD